LYGNWTDLDDHCSSSLRLLKKRNINVVSLTEDVNTNTPPGKLFLQLLARLSEFEHNSISERTKAGLKAARARGRKGGRPQLQTDAIKRAMTKQLHASTTSSIKEICHTLSISKTTLFRYVKMENRKQALAKIAGVLSTCSLNE
jgi:DNA invertase Pin-like site-specific DNA recombinase